MKKKASKVKFCYSTPAAAILDIPPWNDLVTSLQMTSRNAQPTSFLGPFLFVSWGMGQGQPRSLSCQHDVKQAYVKVGVGVQ